MQRSAFCRSRRELSNAYFLAKIGFDRAENEPCKVCPLFVYRSPRCFSRAEFTTLSLKDVEAVLSSLPYLRPQFDSFSNGVRARWPEATAENAEAGSYAALQRTPVDPNHIQVGNTGQGPSPTSGSITSLKSVHLRGGRDANLLDKRISFEL